ncbi:TetR/AcrR family transcriptional regulator [Saccharospirillum salsuginis]|uniref:TetR family transcriptional regulator n=1 Tax=Saccharospirillum salsuginis TaxID=418750 RepID=A0A918NCM9_9GAMM|nr:TetR/AcrR family transcriptional regulator [Saccharospirillum salsuginis]GGX58524.1 TetR family transcriptional regulator [Saccharospirillum salsuginis]
MTRQKKSAYHHGNLKAALIEAGFDFLEADSLDNLSLRAIAKQVGVTPTAAYNHFADKMALMVEMKAAAFLKLDAFLRQHVDEAPSNDPDTRMRALARGYINFAFEHPGLFNLLFTWTPDKDRFTEELTQSAACGETLMRETLTDLLRAEGLNPDHYQQSVASFSSWSLVHGVTLLLKAGVVDAVTTCHHWPEEFASENRESLTRILEHLFTIQIEGLKATLAKVHP